MVRQFCDWLWVTGIPALILVQAVANAAPPNREVVPLGFMPSPERVQEIKAADQEELRAILDGNRDVKQRIWDKEFVVTSAAGPVLGRGDVIRALADGPLPYRSFERETEKVRDYGFVVISMGRESVVPAGREVAGPVIQRFTHVWIKRDGAWRHSVRHASVVPGD